MAWRTEKNGDDIDIVIDGFEEGIADDPYEGIADARNVNILSTPKEAAVQFANAAVTKPPTGVSGAAFSASAAADTFTVASTAGYYEGMAITIDSTSLTPTLDYLVVAGGGGGGGNGGIVGRHGGGGGGGQVATGSSLAAVTSYGVTVGAGGAGNSVVNGNNGSASSFGSLLTGIGGGGGGAQGAAGNAGASGGGGGNSSAAGGTGTAGNNGGSGSPTNTGSGGGGGGAGGAGSNAVTTTGGNGGNGLSSSISGAAVFYGAGGGGGGATPGTTGSGGSGANSGGGGLEATTGGSGIVIVRYVTGSLVATGGTITTSGIYTIHTFTSDGTFSVTGLVVATGTVYYVGSIVGNTFKIYPTIALVTPFDIVGNYTGTYSVPVFGNPYDSVSSPLPDFSIGLNAENTDSFMIDTAGAIWYIGNGINGTLNKLYFTGNFGRQTLVTNYALGINSWNGYLFGFIQNKVDYIKITDFFDTGPSNWVYGWQTLPGPTTGYKSVAATDNALYFCNGDSVGSIIENAGSTFNPATPATYTFNTAALALPEFDSAVCLAQLGTNLLVGGARSFVYPWDRVSTSFSYPLTVAEAYVKNIVSTNASAYIFAGKRGRIYITNGANVELFKKFPDQIANTENPYYQWGAGLYYRNQLQFGISATTNGGTSIPNLAGVWSIDLDTEALSMPNSLSTGSYAGTVPVLLPMGNTNPAGNSLYVGWIDGSGVGGIDYGTSLPYVAGEAYIDTDIIPVGTYYEPMTDQQIEYKLSKPLVAGESVQIFWRGNLNDSFTQVTSITAITGRVSGAGSVNFQKQQWVQLRVKLISTATTPSYVKLRELRMR